jgi:hypothetical protein
MRQHPRFPNSRHRAASDVYSRSVEKLKSTRRDDAFVDAGDAVFEDLATGQMRPMSRL